MRVLVAGDRGYIGAVLVPFLRAAGHEVDGLDVGLYEGCDLGPALGRRRPAAPARDMRDVTAAELAGYDAVVCLAALSNDPLGDLNPAATYSVNLDGTLRLAQAAKEAGVERFLFASSCSLYGAAGSAAVAEDAELFPVTPYGETKVAGRAGPVAAGRRQLQPHLPAQRHRLRRLAPAAPRHRGEQPDRDRADHREGAAGERRDAVAAAGAHRGHQPGVPGRCWRRRGSSSTTRRSTSAARRTTCRSATSPRWSATPCPARASRSPRTPARTCATTASTSPSSNDTFPELELRWTVQDGDRANWPAPTRKYGLTYDDFTSSALRAAAPDPRTAVRRSGRRHAPPSATSAPFPPPVRRSPRRGTLMPSPAHLRTGSCRS